MTITLEKHGDRTYQVVDGTYYNEETAPEVIEILERYRRNRTRIRLRVGDTKTGKDWLEEWNVEGYISRSMGQVKIPILVHTSRSMGGGGILGQCIVRILTASGGRVLYSHPTYNRPAFTIGPADIADYHETVYADGEVHARFKKPGQAAKWVEKMSR